MKVQCALRGGYGDAGSAACTASGSAYASSPEALRPFLLGVFPQTSADVSPQLMLFIYRKQHEFILISEIAPPAIAVRLFHEIQKFYQTFSMLLISKILIMLYNLFMTVRINNIEQTFAKGDTAC